MKLRSLLFVPGDSEKKQDKAKGSGADALIFDLEDSVAPANKNAARKMTSDAVAPSDRPWLCLVRVNPLDTGLTLDDLAAVVKPGLDALMIPKANSAADIEQIGHYLDALETAAGMPLGGVKQVVLATETPAAMFTLGSYAPAHPRLTALTWGAEDLAAAIGARANRGPDGEWSPVFQNARNGCLFAAAAAEVPAIDTVYTDFRNEAGLRAECTIARRDGFVGRMAIHPAQVPIINEAFTPTEVEIAEAKRIVEAFEADPTAGVLAIDGKMIDIPHLKAARRTLAAAN